MYKPISNSQIIHVNFSAMLFWRFYRNIHTCVHVCTCMRKLFYLVVHALQIFCLGFPEFDLKVWRWEFAFEYRLSWVLAEKVAHLVRPVDDDRLKGVNDVQVDIRAISESKPNCACTCVLTTFMFVIFKVKTMAAFNSRMRRALH